MWEKTVYVASDGTEFDLEEAALEHEIKDILVILSNPEHFAAFDSKGSIMDTSCEGLEYTLENAYFMTVKTEKAVEALLGAEAAYTLSSDLPNDIGHFRWDEDTLRWYELLEELERLNENWAALGKKFTLI